MRQLPDLRIPFIPRGAEQSRTHQNRHVGNQRHRLIVLGSGSGEPLAAQLSGQTLDPGQRRRLSTGIGRGDPRSAPKQITLPGLHAGQCRTGHGVTGNEARMERLPTVQHRLLHGTHIRDHGVARQRVHQGRIGLQKRGDGQSQHHKIAALKTARIGAHRTDEPTGQGTVRRLLPMHQPLHLHAMGAEIQPDRPTDQAKTNDPDAPRFHAHAPARSSDHVGRSIAMNSSAAEPCVGFSDA